MKCVIIFALLIGLSYQMQDVGITQAYGGGGIEYQTALENKQHLQAKNVCAESIGVIKSDFQYIGLDSAIQSVLDTEDKEDDNITNQTATTIHYPHTRIDYTHAPGTTQEPSVHEIVSFHYNFHTGKLIIKKNKECYIFTLSDQEKMTIHTDSGMNALEVSLLPMIVSTTKTEVQKDSLDQYIQQNCGNRILHYYVF